MVRFARAFWFLAGLAVLLALAGIATIAALDTDRGRAFVVAQLPLYAPRSGLTVRIGGIDGSLFGRATLHDVVLGDPQGVFATARTVEVDWRPFDLFRRKLSLGLVSSPEVDVLRRPALRPSADKRILPDLDIAVGRLQLDRIALSPGVAGPARLVGVAGNADIADGRARIVLDAAAPGAGDTLRVRLDAEPDRDRFDVDARLAAPAGGVVAGLLGLHAPLTAEVAGDGRWSEWHGTARATLGAAPLADLRLSAASGRFAAAGTLTPAALRPGLFQRLMAPQVTLDATAALADRRATTRFTARSPALVLTGAGVVDFGDESFDGATLDAVALRPTAIAPNLTARDLRLHARVAGSFANPIVDYVVTAPALALGPTGFTQLRAIGIVQLGSRPLTIPLAATARTVTGVTPEAAALLTNLRVTGPLVLVGNILTSDALIVRSDRLSGRAQARVDLAGGGFVATGTGAVPHYAIVNFGLADITATLRAVNEGTGARTTGRTVIRVTRVDNPFFASLLEGLPSVDASIDVAPNGSLTFADARLASPGLTLTAAGSRAVGDIVAVAGSGVSRRYGPVQLRLAGPLAAPTVDVVLARPGFGIGLANVAAHVVPQGADWAFEAKGATGFGPIAARGVVLTGVPARIDLAGVTLAGLTAKGQIVQTAAGPFSGRLALTGAGLSGGAALSAQGPVQRADIALDATHAKLPFASPVAVGKASVRLALLLPDAGPEATGSFTASDVRREGLVLTAASGKLDYHAGRGSATLDAAGYGDAPFTLAGRATFAGDRVEVAGSGVFNDRPIGLAQPAVLTRDSGDWVLAPTTVTTPDGRAELSGRFGQTNAIKARLDNLGLPLLKLVNPALDFGGRVSGTIDASLPAGGLPVGTAQVRISGLSRAGTATASLPIDLALTAQLSATGGSARAVIVRAGIVEGRVQAQLRDIPGTAADAPLERLLAAPLVAQARYVGPAQALWPLAGIQALDIRGPVTIAADIGGKLGDPTLSGTIVTDGARVENTTLGTVVEKGHLDGRFTASRLELTRFSGEVGKGGTISGSGSVGLSAIDGFPLDIKLSLKNAAALRRDDLAATVTGDLHLVSTATAGTISGSVTADKARFRIGRTAAAEVPVLDVREINDELVRRRVAATARPTIYRLDIAVDIPDRVTVAGMGLQSDWRGKLTVKGSATAPAIAGRMRLVRGDYDFAGKRFELTRGDLRFQGSYPPDPVIDIAAENTQGGFTATLTIAGTGLKPEITFGSVPALPQDEVLSRVLFGTGIANLSAPEAIQLAGALASLRGGKGESLNPINIVRKSLGIDRLRILPADTTTGRRTTVAAGEYIGRRVYLELASDAQGYTATNIEVALTRSLSILSQVATLGGTSVNLRLKKDY